MIVHTWNTQQIPEPLYAACYAKTQEIATQKFIARYGEPLPDHIYNSGEAWFFPISVERSKITKIDGAEDDY